MVQDLEFGIRDGLTRLRASSFPEKRIVLIDIDEQSLSAIGPWPWRRETLADLAEQLIEDHGVSHVALDMVLPEARDQRGDERLIQLAHERKLILSEVLDYATRDVPIRTGSLSPGHPIRDRIPSTQATGWVANHSGLSTAPCIGNIGFVPDVDGTLRRLALWSESGSRAYPNLALAIFLCAHERQDRGRVTDELVTLRFPKTSEAWTLIPAHEVLQPHAELPMLANRIAIVGSSALGLSDRVATPLAGSVSGFFVHAQLLAELLDGPSKPLPLPDGSVLLFWMLALSSLGSTLVRLPGGPSRKLSGGLLAALMLSIVGIETLQPSTWPLSPGLLSLLTLLLTLGSYEWARERSLARSSVQLLERYVSDAVLKSLLKTRNFDALQPRHTQITVLVVDLAGYSARVSTLSLEDSTAFTRQILEIMTRPVLAHGGTLDRYTGDGLVAFWGAPLSDPYAADHAVQAALEIQTAIEQEVGCQVRCGLASGEALVGDVGSTHRAHYTAVGNCINLAARLEALAKALGVQVLMDEATAQGLLSHKASALVAREIRGVGPVNLFTVTSRLAP